MAKQAEDTLVQVLGSEPLPLLPKEPERPDVRVWREGLYGYLRNISARFTRANVAASTGTLGGPSGTYAKDWELLWDSATNDTLWSALGGSIQIETEVTDYIDVGTLGVLGSTLGTAGNWVFISMWFRYGFPTGTASGDAPLLGIRASSGWTGGTGEFGVGVEMASTGFPFIVLDRNGTRTERRSNIDVRDGKWHHILFKILSNTTMSDANNQVIVDGAAGTPTTTTTGSTGTANWSANFPISCYLLAKNNAGTTVSEGGFCLSEVVIWHEATGGLGSGEHLNAFLESEKGNRRKFVQFVQRGGFLSRNPETLLAHWPLNEISGTAIEDESGNSHHGTLSGSPFMGLQGVF